MLCHLDIQDDGVAKIYIGCFSVAVVGVGLVLSLCFPSAFYFGRCFSPLLGCCGSFVDSALIVLVFYILNTSGVRHFRGNKF